MDKEPNIVDIEQKVRCKECGLKIRGGNKDRHDAGWHHNNRKGGK